MLSRVNILISTTALACTISAFKAGIAFTTPRPISDPAWYQGKPAFYLFSFAIELLILLIYTLGRVDKRFYVPDGSSKVRTYQREETEDKESRSSFDSV